MDNQTTSENKKNIVAIIHFLTSLLIISFSLFLFNNDGNEIDVFFYIQIMAIIAGLNFLFGTISMALTIIRKKKGLRLIFISEVLTMLALFWPSLFDYLTR